MAGVMNLAGAPETARVRGRAEDRNRVQVEWLDPLGYDVDYAFRSPPMQQRLRAATLSDVSAHRDQTWRPVPRRQEHPAAAGGCDLGEKEFAR